MQMLNVARRILPTLALAVAMGNAAGAAAQSSSAAPPANEPTLAAAEAQEFFGDWVMSLETPDGTMPIEFTIGERDGKVAVTFGGADGEAAITNISKVGDGFVARSQIDYQGMTLPMLITVTPEGEDLRTDWDFGDGAYVSGGTARRAS